MASDAAAKVFPVLDSPLPVAAPDVPYVGLLVWIAVAPKLDAGLVDATASIVVKPYRILKDGTIDTAPEAMWRTLNVASVDEALETGTDLELAAAIGQMAAVLQTYLAKGL